MSKLPSGRLTKSSIVGGSVIFMLALNVRGVAVGVTVDVGVAVGVGVGVPLSRDRAATYGQLSSYHLPAAAVRATVNRLPNRLNKVFA